MEYRNSISAVVGGDELIFFVNGKKVVEKNADPETTLLTYLRNNLRLTGSKLGCGEGGCGACTVMVSKWDSARKRARHFSVNACLAPVVSVHECAVTTVEGIGSTRTKLHQVQERLARFHGSQCGFCTPGIVMSMYALLRNKKVPAARDIETCLQGNLCRCTGYRPIISAFQTFTCGMGDKCCKLRKNKGNSEAVTNNEGDRKWEPYDPSQEPIFPPELMLNDARKQLTFKGESVVWYQPVSLQEMLSLKSNYPDARVVVGNTEVGIEMNIKGRTYEHIICPTNVPELNVLKSDSNAVIIGAACPFSDVEQFLRSICAEKSLEQTQVLTAMLEMLQLFAGVQIRNVACIGGNVMTASPISDLNPILLACGAKLTFSSAKSERREVVMDEKFFTGYRKTNTRPDEVLVSLSIPLLTANDVMYAYKQSKRKEDDIAIVNAAMQVSFQPGTNIIERLSMAYGGMAAVTKMPEQAMKNGIGRRWDKQFLEDISQWLCEEMQLTLDAPGGMVEYRRTLVTSFFFKFYHHTFANLVKRGIVEENNVKASRSIIEHISAEDEPFTSCQTWEEVPPDQDIDDLIGRPVEHISGLKHATGEAQYTDDIPPYRDELHLAPVCSTRAHAKIMSVDTTEALATPGVVDYVDINDVVGENLVNANEDVFADGTVTCVGHVIGAIVADTQAHALKAARLVKFQYEDILPKIITIEDAIEHKSFYAKHKLVKGNATEGFREAEHIIEAGMRVGGQEHFYLETQSCIAIPRNSEGEMEIICASQDSTALQKMAATCLGVARNKVTARAKRLGGGFGGKETKWCKVSNPVVIAARKLGKPVRCMLTRQDDMQITGGRHPFLGQYKVGFNKDGRVVGLQLKLYNNGGNTEDLSVAVMHKAMLQAENCYNIPNVNVEGYVCRTNIASNTAFRGFGAPQSMLIVEDCITRVADHLKKTPEEIRELNMYNDGDQGVYGGILKKLQLRRCWQECIQRTEFNKERRKIKEFNENHRWKKRGIACVPAMYSVGFPPKLLNQAGSLVLIYTDGTVLLSHGGTEMGQGLHTKMIQVASKVLGIPIDLIHISETSTAAVPNASPTAASVASDLNGMAVKDACEQIVARLAPLKKSNPTLQWKELIEKAYEERISLAASGFYKRPNIEYTWNTDTGEICGDWAYYQTSGVALTEVEIDVLTGHHVMLKTEIVMDLGRSMNPSIDIGQIEGAFAQGYGLVTLEEPLHSPSGQLLTVGPGAYKIPGFSDTPKNFNIHLLKGSRDGRAVYSSKAVGEPPFLLAISAFCAIRDAIENARADAGLKGSFRLDSPATAERIRMACEDQFTKQAKVSSDKSDVLIPWSIRT